MSRAGGKRDRRQQIKAWVCNRLGIVIVSHLVIITIASEILLNVKTEINESESLCPAIVLHIQSPCVTAVGDNLGGIFWHPLIADRSRGIFSVTADRFAIFPWLILSPRGMKSLRFSEQGAWTPIKLTVRATPPGSPTKQILAAILMLASVTGQTESNFSPKIYALFMQSLINPFKRLFSQINSTRKLDQGSDV